MADDARTPHIRSVRSLLHACSALVCLLAFAAILAGEASPAGDPERPNCWPGPLGSDPRDCPPNEPRWARHWEFLSGFPDGLDLDLLHPAERALGGGGIALDAAWQVTTGRDDVVIAVLDSGIRWADPDLLNQFWLNPGELPPPAGSERHDANGDGRFDIRDYIGDPRVGDRNGNGVLDPGDLILAFSNCRDDDGNGYVDDISGYDFAGSGHCGSADADNNPHDETDFGHGTGIAGTAAGETNNGIGDVGVCPGCRVLPVRVGDSFVVDANRFARGVVFAARSNAAVIASALGSYNNTPAARSAVDFAWERGTTIVGSAADEFSYHHNFPSVYPRSLYVNAIRFNHVDDPSRATTFWGLNPCTNFGPRVSLSVPAVSCSSGATSRLAGTVGLVISAARDAGHAPLHPGEVHQLLFSTVDDLDNSEPDWGAAMYRALPGFDATYGHGRLNALRAVTAARAGRIPPIVELDGPEWFSIVSPSNAKRLAVTGSIGLPRAVRADWRIDYGIGEEPAEGDWIRVAAGSVSGPSARVAGELDWSKLPQPQGAPPRGREDRARYAVSLRLVAIDDAGRRAEERRSFFVFDDPSWKRGFPIALGASGEAGPLLVDLDGNGRDAIVLPTADGILRIVRQEAEGPVMSEVRLASGPPLDPLDPSSAIPETVVRGAAVGDLTGRGEMAIVVATHDGRIHALSAAGKPLRGFPVRLPALPAGDAAPDQVVESGILSRPVLADLDGRPGLEIVVTALDGRIHVWRGNGKPLAGFPVALVREGGRRAKIVSTPVVADLDGDGRPEIVSGSNGLRRGLAAAWAVRAAGNADPRGPFLRGWDPLELPGLRPDLLPTIASGIAMEPVAVDADGDGDAEIVLYAVTGTDAVLIDTDAESGARVVARFEMRPDTGSALQGMSFIAGTGSPLVADTDGDGRAELYAPLLPFRMLTLRSKPGVPIDVPLALGGWPLDGDGPRRSMLAGWPQRMEDLMIFAKPAAADVDGDGHAEILMGSGGYLLHAFRGPAGEGEPDGWPKYTGGWIFSAPAIGDLDGDGRLDVVSVTREGYLFAWNSAGSDPRSMTRKPSVTRTPRGESRPAPIAIPSRKSGK